MPYIERNNGRIVGVYAKKQQGYAEELVPDDDPDLVEFLAKTPGTRCEEPVEQT
ncbi:hypothetical protein [Agrobacterium tumefaciens]|uniref:hypothetical protein n=1 Tax=Agrobacterium tumefaciens TaxID=358 RepID=UPI0021D094BE|nr:hypothetical protein [Agrobacterium tumefaciens]UXS23111.1 hypothetical protein FY153_01090 [Agrobacterium tumefaciens]